jgi:hypothetical protein
MTAMLHRYIGVAAVPGFQGRLSDPRPVHLPELLGLRGVAILIIVCGHLLHRICPFQTELDGVTGPGLPSKRAALATALFGCARRAACLEGGRSSLTLMV